MLCKNIKNRISVDQILQLPFILEISSAIKKKFNKNSKLKIKSKLLKIKVPLDDQFCQKTAYSNSKMKAT